MNLLGIAAGASQAAQTAAAEGLAINPFWILVVALNFLFFFLIVKVFILDKVMKMLDDRRDLIEQGLRDAEAARQAKDDADALREAVLHQARREAKDILEHSQKVAQETREAEMAALRGEIERLREKASLELNAEKERALEEMHDEVVDLALTAAGRVVGDVMTGERQRALVEQFLREATISSGTAEA
jgi:F-type H+-transporting ATPase subunit b